MSWPFWKLYLALPNVFNSNFIYSCNKEYFFNLIKYIGCTYFEQNIDNIFYFVRIVQVLIRCLLRVLNQFIFFKYINLLDYNISFKFIFIWRHWYSYTYNVYNNCFFNIFVVGNFFLQLILYCVWIFWVIVNIS